MQRLMYSKRCRQHLDQNFSEENTFLLLLKTWMMSHLTGSAVPDQGCDHHSFLGLLLSQAEAKTYTILGADW